MPKLHYLTLCGSWLMLTSMSLPSLLRLIRPQHEPVHFHAGDRGRPYVCHDLRCSSPRLDIPA
jgi:hypothetical protein